MSASALETAFAHHVWATIRLIQGCSALTPEQLQITVPGTFGSILATLRHLVGSDSFDLFVAYDEWDLEGEADAMTVEELRAGIARNGAGWAELLTRNPNPEEMKREVDPNDGYQRDAPLGIRLAQALHHGNDHRTQVCTALTSLGLTPPDLSAFQFGVETEQVVEVYPDKAG